MSVPVQPRITHHTRASSHLDGHEFVAPRRPAVRVKQPALGRPDLLQLEVDGARWPAVASGADADAERAGVSEQDLLDELATVIRGLPEGAREQLLELVDEV